MGIYENEEEMEPILNNLMILGLMLGITKFSLKAALGCGFAALSKREILVIASVYLVLALIIGVLMGMLHEISDKFLNILLDSAPLLGLLQGIIALFLVVFGLRTIKKWVDGGENLSRKTFLMLSVPCPGTIATIFISCLFLIMMGLKGIKVGLLIGGVFFLFILGISLGIRKSRLKKNPSSLGGVMVFFGLFYLLSILLIPAYLPVSKMDITMDFPVDDMTPGFLFIVTMIATGFILERIDIRDKLKWNYSQNL
ncbi:MAG: DUF2162 domain-containing protein [Candidatus Altiarchaeota archaeon]|nr:DUF2162 domain-containing protein [Candidatus Altiarchaeota archaeon]